MNAFSINFFELCVFPSNVDMKYNAVVSVTVQSSWIFNEAGAIQGYFVAKQVPVIECSSQNKHPIHFLHTGTDF